jgi:hypothetical protein
MGDLDTLKLEEYDRMCGEERRYHSVREMAKKRNSQERKWKKNNPANETDTQ